MRKETAFFLVLLILFSAGAFAEEISKTASTYVSSFLEESGVSKDKITNVTKVDNNRLPEEIEIQNIEKNNLGIYQVNYDENGTDKKVYFITYSSENLPEKSSAKNSVTYLNFGYPGILEESSYINTATNAAGGKDSGYVMMRSGSITGISTSLGTSEKGAIELKVYINGKDTGFKNAINSDDSKKIDYDTQSENAVTYSAGDIISVYAELAGGIKVSSITTLVEATE